MKTTELFEFAARAIARRWDALFQVADENGDAFAPA